MHVCRYSRASVMIVLIRLAFMGSFSSDSGSGSILLTMTCRMQGLESIKIVIVAGSRSSDLDRMSMVSNRRASD